MDNITLSKIPATAIWALEITLLVKGMQPHLSSHPPSAQELNWEQLQAAVIENGQKSEIRTLGELFNKKYNLPGVCRNRNGKYFVLLGIKKDKEKALVLEPYSKTPVVITRDELEHMTDGIILVIKNPKINAGSVFGLRWFINEIIKYRPIFLSILTGSFVLQLLAMAAPLFTQVILDKVLLHHTITTLNVLALGFSIVTIFEFLIKITRNYILVNTTNKIDAGLGSQIYKKLLTMPYVYFDTRQVGEVISRVREIDRIRDFITDKSVTVIIDTIFSLLFVAVMLIYSIKLTLFVIFFIIMSGILYGLITPELRTRLEEKFRKSAVENSFLVESITGIETVKSLCIESEMTTKWQHRLAEYINAGYKLSLIGNITGSAITLMQKFMTIGILYFGVREVIGSRMSVGQLIAFQMFAAQFSIPMLRLVNLWNDFQQTLLAVDRIGEILNCKSEAAGGRTLTQFKGNIRFENVSFRYKPDSPFILRGITFEIKAGERIGIVGRSGSGKSTIGKLIRRLYDASEGKIYIDGIDLTTISPACIRKHIGTVLQDNYLFSGSIKENILKLSPYSGMRGLQEVCKLAGVQQFINQFPMAYDTAVGERGGALSGGQRQRIAIARSLIRQPEILLYDEATSALDYETEQTVLNNIELVSRGKTAIIIAHRLSALKWCDRIIFIEGGRILEEGTHEELISSGGYYSRLYMTQQTGGQAA